MEVSAVYSDFFLGTERERERALPSFVAWAANLW
jgi:hypothetical protein